MLSNKRKWIQVPLFTPKEKQEDSIIKVFIADPHVMVREGTKRILENTDDFVVIGEAETYGPAAARPYFSPPTT